MKRPMDNDLGVALRYLNQVKRTLGGGGSKKYKSLYTLLVEFRDGTLSVSDLISSVNQLLSGHDDLLQGFTFFLPITSIKVTDGPKEYINGDEYDVGSRKVEKFRDKGFPKRQKFSDNVMSQIQQGTDLANKVRERFNDGDGVYKSFLDSLCGYYEKEGKTSTIHEFEKKMKLLLEDDPDLLIELSRYTADLYVADEYEKSRWESMKKGSNRDESYDQEGWKKKDRYETMMFKYEDQHFEADVAFHRFESAKEKMKLFIQDAEAAGGRPITDLNEYFTPINLRCIKQLYGDEDQLEMMEQLRKNPIKSGGIVLKRLNQKLVQIKDYMSKAEKVWAKVYKDCHEKLQRKRRD